MGLSSTLFTWLHQSKFYRQFHEEAVNLLPTGNGQTWLDFGCGPGVLTRAASQKGYKALGVDYDSEMISKAKQLTRTIQSNTKFSTDIEYKQYDIFTDPALLSSELSKNNFKRHVVSASSFLPVFENKNEILSKLCQFVEAGGLLLLIETNQNCTLRNAFHIFRKDISFSEAGILLLGAVRSGKSKAIESIEQHFAGQSITRYPLSNGIVDAFIVRNLSTNDQK